MRSSNQRGFTLIEILMVLVLVAVLSAVALNAFINFRTEARDAALRSNLAALRASIAAQYAQMQLRCGTDPGVFPAAASLSTNSITDGASTCTITMVTIASERAFIQGSIPTNPWSAGVSAVTACAAPAGSCTPGADGVECDGTGTATGGWCYNAATGQIWADTADVTKQDF